MNISQIDPEEFKLQILKPTQTIEEALEFQQNFTEQLNYTYGFKESLENGFICIDSYIDVGKNYYIVRINVKPSESNFKN